MLHSDYFVWTQIQISRQNILPLSGIKKKSQKHVEKEDKMIGKNLPFYKWNSDAEGQASLKLVVLGYNFAMGGRTSKCPHKRYNYQ